MAVKSAVHALTVRVLRADRPATGAPCIACGTSRRTSTRCSPARTESTVNPADGAVRVDGDTLEVRPERVDRRGVQVAAACRHEGLRDAAAGQRDDHEPAVDDVLLDDGSWHGGEAEAGEQRRVERPLLELERVLGIDMGAERVRGERLGRAATFVGEMAVLDQVAHGGAT